MTHLTERLLLGVDTGGTYTDAVILDAASLEVRASAKALTTRHDLAVGVSNALKAISDSFDADLVDLVSVSTTLATNAVVEGHGSPILVILVGFDEGMVERTGIAAAFGDAVIVRVAGGHDHYGSERVQLDTEDVARALDEHSKTVRAVAVASTFAVRNAAHEHAIRDMVIARTELPVTVSSSLSESLDAPRRALTTALNARLLSRITDLVEAVRRSIESIGIDAPVMVAKGDGSLAAADSVAQRPIETVLSGPAASIVGAAALTGLEDFVLSDIGGTTTDVGQLRSGRPRLVSDGARVGGWRTMVSAIDVRTTGIGGDSEVHTDRSDVSVGPHRRIPLSLLALDHPEVVQQLQRELHDPPPRDSAGTFVVRVSESAQEKRGLSLIEARVLDRVEVTPTPLTQIAAGALERNALRVLVAKGLLQLSGFTPSDAAHVLSLQDNWSSLAAEAGAELLAWYTGDSGSGFARKVWSETVRRSSACVLEVAFADHVDDLLSNPLVEAAIGGSGSVGGVEVRLRPVDPLVAVGGPAGVFYPEVARRCGAELVLPEGFSVANAVGAAAGHIVARSHAEVHGDGPSMFRVVSAEGSETHSDASEALRRAEELATRVAVSLLDERASGLTDSGPVVTHVDIERHDAPDAVADTGLYGARVDVEVRSRPVGGAIPSTS
ncbi:MAG: hydantoinase/oxoprolinase family protein [Acidimicrobiia bacterium]|nr:hydantoinase/oxoprolinase family protein [Acidimicrobiia bacterium]